MLVSPSTSYGLQVLFNAPEGCARLALEHQIRPSAKLAALCFTGLTAQQAVRFVVSAPQCYVLPSHKPRLASNCREDCQACSCG